MRGGEVGRLSSDTGCVRKAPGCLYRLAILEAGDLGFEVVPRRGELGLRLELGDLAAERKKCVIEGCRVDCCARTDDL